MSQMKTRNSPFVLKRTGDEGHFEGYGSVFGVVDSYKDVVEPGAFSKSLESHRNNGTLPAMLWQHDPREPIGVYSEMREDEQGLFVRGRLALDTQRGKEAHDLLKMGAVRGLSIGFMPVEQERVDGLNRVREVDLWEVSLVTFPANESANVDAGSVKSIEPANLKSFSDVEKCLRDAGHFSRSQATAIVARIRQIDRERREAVTCASDAKQGAEALIEKLLS